MTNLKHPSRSLLADYATGVLATGPSLTVESHLEGCAECRSEIARVEATEGQLLNALPPTQMAPDALDRVFARIDGSTPWVEPTAREQIAGLEDVPLPRSVAAFDLRPRRWLSPGFWVAHVDIPPEDDWRTFIIRAPAKSRIPAHSHPSHEYISVLTGAFIDGEHFDVGDFGENLAGSSHTLKVGGEAPCACLIAIRGNVEWHGWAKIIGPALGI
ncbi:ChrR family anti-sigma-E factor [soil metagenome]